MHSASQSVTNRLRHCLTGYSALAGLHKMLCQQRAVLQPSEKTELHQRELVLCSPPTKSSTQSNGLPLQTSSKRCRV